MESGADVPPEALAALKDVPAEALATMTTSAFTVGARERERYDTPPKGYPLLGRETEPNREPLIAAMRDEPGRL